MFARLITPPAAEPLTIAEAKLWLRVDHAEEDALVASLIATARAAIEREARRRLVTQGWRVILDAWPESGVVDLPVAPAQSVEAVRVHAGGGPVVVPPASYRLDLSREPARLWLTGVVPAPEIASGGIEIDVTAGYGPPAAAPPPLLHAVRLMLARLYERRGDGPFDLPALTADIAPLVAPFRLPRL